MFMGNPNQDPSLRILKNGKETNEGAKDRFLILDMFLRKIADQSQTGPAKRSCLGGFHSTSSPCDLNLNLEKEKEMFGK